jgi:hypothetical protein
VEGSTTRLATGPRPELVAAGRKDTGGGAVGVGGGSARRVKEQRHL